MQFRLYQIQIAIGVALALILQLLRHGAPQSADTPIYATMEVAAFGLCILGVFTGGRSMHMRYEALGSDKTAAMADAEYGRARKAFQPVALGAVAALASLAASRLGFDPFYSAIIVLAVGAVLLPLANRLMGWTPGSG